MSLKEVLEFVHSTPAGPQAGSIADAYGTENFCLFLYSLLRMEKPEHVVELGVGAGVTSCLAAQALADNAKGHLWMVDNGSDWSRAELREWFQAARGYNDPSESYADYINSLLASLGLERRTTFVQKHLVAPDFFVPKGKLIDVVFADAPPSDAEGCVQLLSYYLPRMRSYSSIFIDRASTINHSYLILNYLVEQLNLGKIPACLRRRGLSAKLDKALVDLVATCRFSIVHLAETRSGKRNAEQNSRAWIRIEPVDYLPHNDVISFA
jgi:predicted O-methyltransferase YrrM